VKYRNEYFMKSKYAWNSRGPKKIGTHSIFSLFLVTFSIYTGPQKKRPVITHQSYVLLTCPTEYNIEWERITSIMYHWELLQVRGQHTNTRWYDTNQEPYTCALDTRKNINCQIKVVHYKHSEFTLGSLQNLIDLLEDESVSTSWHKQFSHTHTNEFNSWAVLCSRFGELTSVTSIFIISLPVLFSHL